jgi:hypothetical protein
MSRESDDLGYLAEKAFALVCAQTRIRASRPDRDRGGWDYLLEVPPADANAGSSLAPIDVSPEIVAFVQVKATRKRERSVRLSLAGAQRLAYAYHPAFLAALVFQAGPHQVGFYLVHFDEALVERTLRRIRELRAQGTRRLSGRTLTVPLREVDRLDHDSGAGLAAAIRRYVGPSFAEYIACKEQWRTGPQLGELHHRFQLQFEFPAGVDANDILADFAIGLRQTLQARPVALEEVRFGIPVPLPISEEAIAELITPDRPQPRPAVLTLTNNNRSVIARHQCSVRAAAGVFPFLPPEYRRVRMQSDLLEIIADPKRQGATITFVLPTPAHRYTLAQLAEIGKVLRLITRGSEDGLFIDLDGFGRLTGFEVPDPAAPVVRSARELAEVIAYATQVAAAFELPQDTAMTPHDLYCASAHLRQLALLLDPSKPQREFRATFTSGSGSPPSAKFAHIVYLLGARLGGFVIATVIDLGGVPTFISGAAAGEWVLVLGRFATTIREHWILKPDAVDQAFLDRHVAAHVAALDTGSDVLVLRMGSERAYEQTSPSSSALGPMPADAAHSKRSRTL